MRIFSASPGFGRLDSPIWLTMRLIAPIVCVRALDELRTAGYAVLRPLKDERGLFCGSCWTIYELPRRSLNANGDDGLRNPRQTRSLRKTECRENQTLEIRNRILKRSSNWGAKLLGPNGGNVGTRFRDEERNYIFGELETLGFENETSRRTWIGRVRDYPALTQRALGILKENLQEQEKKIKRPLGKLFSIMRTLHAPKE